MLLFVFCFVIYMALLLTLVLFQNFQQVGRSLFCLGLLIRYSSSLLYVSGSSNNSHVASSINLFKRYLQTEDYVIKVRSLQVSPAIPLKFLHVCRNHHLCNFVTFQALGYVLIARPECMLEKDVGKILEATLSSNTDPRLKVTFLLVSCF